jgi:methyl-accepting chemotaxis protein
VPKLTRVASFKPWGWIFLDGVYVDDIDSAFHRSLIKSGTILAAVAVMLSVVIAALNRGLQRSLGGEPDYAAETARRIASGDLSVPVNTRGTSKHSTTACNGGDAHAARTHRRSNQRVNRVHHVRHARDRSWQ